MQVSLFIEKAKKDTKFEAHTDRILQGQLYEAVGEMSKFA